MTEKWQEEELLAAVRAYVEMHRNETQGTRYTKKSYYENLSHRFGRSVKAFEYRMQNISHVYALQGRRWLSGLRPAKNVGTNVTKLLVRLISEVEGQTFGASAVFEAEVSKLRKSRPSNKPTGALSPEKVSTSITQFKRDPAVVAWVLEAADGVCELCGKSAPFSREDGTPFLEVHHVTTLADGGEDTVNNAVAL